ncbi:MAG: PAS domain S-box protein [Chitinivibrionales bacterium]|nr:PAS domain S-box protein [Chitinivibrionales bacterium]
MIKYIATASYWLLIVMWSFILTFCLRRMKMVSRRDTLTGILLIILAIDAFRTLFESSYFGAWYSALSGLLPMSVHDLLVLPQWILIPKLMNVVAAALIIGILIRKWLPEEMAVKNRHCAILAQSEDARKTAEARFRESELRFQEIAAAIEDIFWMADGEMRQILYVSPAFEKIWDRPCEELYANNAAWLQSVHPRDKEHIAEAVRDIPYFDGLNEEYRIVRSDGSLRWIHDRAYPIYDDAGSIARVVGIARDITEQKETEEKIFILKEELEERVEKRTRELQNALVKLGEREATLLSIFRAAPISIGLQCEQHLTNVNDWMCTMLGYSHEELSGQSSGILYADANEYRRVNSEQFHQIDRFGVGTTETHWQRKDGIIIGILLSFSPIEPGDLSAGVTFTALDITERKKTEAQLRTYSETQAALLREVNHRVKNNLAAIISVLHMEQDKAQNEGNNGCLWIISDLIARIQGLSAVHSLLSASEWSPLNLTQLCKQIIENALQGVAYIKDITLTVTQSTVQVNSNQAHNLGLVMSELATNSVKYALGDRDAARIDVTIRSEGNYVSIRYHDDGPGFPREIADGDMTHTNVGIELINGIVSQNLNGIVELFNDSGATAVIELSLI